MAPSNHPLGRHGCSVRLVLASNLGGLLGMPNGESEWRSEAGAERALHTGRGFDSESTAT